MQQEFTHYRFTWSSTATEAKSPAHFSHQTHRPHRNPWFVENPIYILLLKNILFLGGSKPKTVYRHIKDFGNISWLGFWGGVESQLVMSYFREADL